MVLISRLKWWFRRQTPAYKRQKREDRVRRNEFYLRQMQPPLPLLDENAPAQVQAAVNKANSYYTRMAQ